MAVGRRCSNQEAVRHTKSDGVLKGKLAESASQNDLSSLTSSSPRMSSSAWEAAVMDGDGYLSHAFDIFDELMNWWVMLPRSLAVKLLKVPTLKNVQEEFLGSTLILMDMNDCAASFLHYCIKVELIQNDKMEVAFRCDSVYLQILSEAMRLYASEYLNLQLTMLLDHIAQSQAAKKKSGDIVMSSAETLITNVLNSQLPKMIIFLLHTASSLMTQTFAVDGGAQMCVVALFFLRCLVPAIINPASVRIPSSLIGENKLLLVKVAKEVQSFANSTLSPESREKHKLWKKSSAAYWEFCETVEKVSEAELTRIEPMSVPQATILQACSKMLYVFDMYTEDFREGMEGTEYVKEFNEIFADCKAKKQNCSKDLTLKQMYSCYFNPRDFGSVLYWLEMERLAHRFTLILYFKRYTSYHREWLKSFSPFCESLMRNDAVVFAAIEVEEKKAAKLREEWKMGFSIVGDPNQDLRKYLVDRTGYHPDKLKGAAIVLLDPFEKCLFKAALREDADLYYEKKLTPEVMKRVNRSILKQKQKSQWRNSSLLDEGGSSPLSGSSNGGSPKGSPALKVVASRTVSDLEGGRV